MLLSLTANLHAASRDPQRWPQAWAALCQWFDCPDVFVSGKVASTDLPALLIGIATCSTKARHCAQSAGGRCCAGSSLDLNKRRSCLALVDHLDQALTTQELLESRRDVLTGKAGLVAAASDAYSLGINRDPRLSVLDALPFPVFVCCVQRRILFVNTLGATELTSGSWLRRIHDRIVGANPQFERRITSTLDTSYGQEGDHRLWLLGQFQEEVDLVWRRVATDAGDTHLVLRLVKHGRQDQPDMSQPALALGLSARQRELAELLLGGCTLTDAAQRMGIVRGSANELLKRLFTATGTRRQTELIACLSRRLLS